MKIKTTLCIYLFNTKYHIITILVIFFINKYIYTYIYLIATKKKEKKLHTCIIFLFSIV